MDLPNTRLWRDDPRPMASPPLIVVPTDIKPAVVLEAVKVWPGKAGVRRKVGATANLELRSSGTETLPSADSTARCRERPAAFG